MSRSRVVNLSVLAAIILILLGAVFYYYLHGRIFADSFYGSEISRQNKNWDVDSDGEAETVSVIKYQNGSKNNFILAVVNQNGKSFSLQLTGFESEVDFCKDNEFILLGQNKAICLWGYVGAHSENIQLITYNGASYLPVQFINNDSTEDRITSDSPGFGFNNLNSNSTAEMYVDNRNYDADPTLDILRSYYYFIDGVFRYNRVESIHYSGQSSGDGSIN